MSRPPCQGTAVCYSPLPDGKRVRVKGDALYGKVPPRPVRSRLDLSSLGRGFFRSVMLLEPLGEILDVLRRPARHFHAEVQAHPGEHFLDLVQGLAAEVRGAEH